MEDLVIKYFQYFYKKLSGRPLIRMKDSELSMVRNFVKLLKDNTGEEYLFRYMCYQFHRWHDLETRFGKNNIQLGWVIGKKAYDLFISDSDHHWYSYITDLNKKFGISKSDLIKPKLALLNELFDYEERDKLIYYNTPKGLLFCTDFTSMYHPDSSICKACMNKSDCITMMKSKLSLVYSSRMEGCVVN